jgi:hypothetical protein
MNALRQSDLGRSSALILVVAGGALLAIALRSVSAEPVEAIDLLMVALGLLVGWIGVRAP